MRLRWPNGAPVGLKVKLVLDHGVALKDPELYQIDGTEVTRLTDPVTTAASATWENVEAVVGDADLTLQIYWIAYDPMQPTWRYQAIIDVTDMHGVRLLGRLGHTNPTILPRDLADHWDHGHAPIVVR